MDAVAILAQAASTPIQSRRRGHPPRGTFPSAVFSAWFCPTCACCFKSRDLPPMVKACESTESDNLRVTTLRGRVGKHAPVPPFPSSRVPQCPWSCRSPSGLRCISWLHTSNSLFQLNEDERAPFGTGTVFLYDHGGERHHCTPLQYSMSSTYIVFEYVLRTATPKA